MFSVYDNDAIRHTYVYMSVRTRYVLRRTGRRRRRRKIPNGERGNSVAVGGGGEEQQPTTADYYPYVCFIWEGRGRAKHRNLDTVQIRREWPRADFLFVLFYEDGIK